jgi:iron complex outermembrane receptor protein
MNTRFLRVRAVPRAAALALALGASTGTPAQTQAASSIALERVVVTGSTVDDRFGENAREPSSTTRLSGRQVEGQHAENLIQVLKAIPGVTIDTQGGDDLKIKFRGVETQRYMGEKPGVAIVIDGVPVFERTGRVNISLDNIQSIQVVKGGASYLFGEDALAGAVIITTKRGAGHAGGATEFDRGANDITRVLQRLGFAQDKLSGHLQFSRRSADGYGFQSNYEAQGLAGNLRWMPDERSDLTLGVENETRYRDKHGTVTGVTQALEDPRGVLGRDYARHFDVGLQRTNLTYSRDLDADTNLLALAYQYTDHTVFWSAPQRFSATGAPVSSSDAYTTLNDYDQTQRGLKTEWRSTRGRVALLGGAELKRNRYLNLTSAMVAYRNSPGGVVTPQGMVMGDDETREQGKALYAEAKWSPLPDWTGTTNLRHDRITLDYAAQPVAGNGNLATAESKSFGATSWRLGVAWTPNAHSSVFGNVSTGFRIPTVDQLYRGSQSPSNSVANNPDLRPERALNVEIGARRRFELFGRAASVEAALFQIDRKDFILDTNGQYGNANAANIGRYENIGGARSRGLELALHAAAGPMLQWDLAYTWLQAWFTKYDRFNLALGNPRGGLVGSSAACPAVNPNWNNCYTLVAYDNTGHSLPRVPRHTLDLRGTLTPAAGWKLWGELDYRAGSWADEIQTNKWPGRTVFNAMAEYGAPLRGSEQGRVSVFLRIDNVFARRFYTIARGTNDSQSYASNFRYDGVYNAEDMSITVDPGRVWRAGVSISF